MPTARRYEISGSVSVEKYFTSERRSRVIERRSLEKDFLLLAEKFRISDRPCFVVFIIQTPNLEILKLKIPNCLTFAVKGAIYYVTIATVISEDVMLFLRVNGFSRESMSLVFYNKWDYRSRINGIVVLMVWNKMEQLSPLHDFTEILSNGTRASVAFHFVSQQLVLFSLAGKSH